MGSCIRFPLSFTCIHMRICIIDDEADCHLLAQKLIEKLVANPDFLHFINGQQAIDYIIRQKSEVSSLPELIFLDINMPVVNGWEFLKMLHSLLIRNYHPVIYMCSSSQDMDDISMAQTYAVKDYLFKPLTLTVLKDILSDFG